MSARTVLFVSPSEAAERLGWTEAEVIDGIRAGRVPAWRASVRNLRIPVAWLDGEPEPVRAQPASTDPGREVDIAFTVRPPWDLYLDRSPCHVYVMRCEARTKIGISHKPEGRRRTLQTASGEDVALAWVSEAAARWRCFAVEQALHVALGPYRLRGEWFTVRPSSAMLERVARELRTLTTANEARAALDPRRPIG